MRGIIHSLSGGLIPLIGLIVVLAVLPVAGVPRSWLLYLLLFFIYLAMANMWNLLCGYSGLISLCQPAFIGLAGYTLVIWAWHGLPIYLGMVLGAIVAALFALLISIPVFRLSGIYFAIGTLVVPEALKYVFLVWRPIGKSIHGGGAGYILKGASDFSTPDVYWLALGLVIASGLCLRIVLRSRLGLGLAAIRDNDRTAASSGIDVFKSKLYSFVISAFVTGLAGTIFYTYQSYIEPNSAFSVKWTMILILATVMGGMGTEGGPIIGTIIVVFLHFLLARYAGISLIIQGTLLVIIMLLVPEGITGFIRKTRAYRSLLQLATMRAS
ncbi:MAG: branched-chain amino acid ABC transporter permease [Desulfobacteraceae bacterium]|jgi:branched-chain amino acid transport system permease protein